MTSDVQKKIILKAGLSLTDNIINNIEKSVNSNSVSLSEPDTLEALKVLNAIYRAGEIPMFSGQLITDVIYDQLFLNHLENLNPDHPFLDEVEPEDAFEGDVIPLPERMLSTKKAYSIKEIEAWLKRVRKACVSLKINFDALEFECNSKLDGFAAYDDGTTLYTRGNGYSGTEITRAFDRGLSVINGASRGLGPGEIVVDKYYFKENLSKEFEFSRNFQSSVIKEHDLSPLTKKAVDDKAVVFHPFSELPVWKGNAESLMTDFEEIVSDIWGSTDFDCDGVVISLTNMNVRKFMGSTNHHHKWQIAFKENSEFKDVPVRDVTPQTAKTGRITPVAELEPTKISNAVLSRATCHHYGNLIKEGIGIGAIVRVYRSGLVIPYIKTTIKRAEKVDVPTHCPSCSAPAEMIEHNLYCTNKIDCPAQVEKTIEYFFKTLGNCKGFGPKAIQKICEFGATSISNIYLTDDFQPMGFGKKTSDNLIKALKISRSVSVEDWRFLASFSINGIGRGGCEKLLKKYPMEVIFDLSISQLQEVDGFALISATNLFDALKVIKIEYNKLKFIGFNLKTTELSVNEVIQDNPIKGKTLVFTGTMIHGKRSDMEKEAKAKGAKVAKSVSKSISLLVIGEKVGAKKMTAAQDFDIPIITEDEYLKLLM